MSAAASPEQPGQALRVGHTQGRVLLGLQDRTLGFSPPEALALAALLLQHASEILSERSIVQKAIEGDG